jgi:protein phosphatase
VEAHALDVHAGDRLLLCSDGLTEMVTNEANRNGSSRGIGSSGCLQDAVAQANDAGGRDNITAVIVRLIWRLPRARDRT